MVLSSFNSAYVFARAGVYLNQFAFIDEKRHAYGGSGLDCGRLESVRGRVSFESRLCVGDFEDGLYGHLCIKHGVGRGVADHFNCVALLHECRSCHEFLVDGNLLESLIVHEDVVAAVGVEILIGAAFNTHVLKFLADVEAAFEYAAVNYVFKFRTHESVALAWFYVKELHNEIETAVHADACAVFDVLSVDHMLSYCIDVVNF